MAGVPHIRMSNLLALALPALLALITAAVLTPVVRRAAFRFGAVDVPDLRKIHDQPIARLGGVAVLAAILLATVVIQLTPALEREVLSVGVLAALAIGILPILVVSLIDDLKGVRAGPKFVSHIMGAGMAVALGIRLNPEVHLFGTQFEIDWLAIPISIIWIAAVTNAFNLVDGLDGLSAGLALISAISLGAVSATVGKYEMAVTAFVVAGALAGFLPFNVHPASIFLGDTGSACVGFLLGCLALRGGSTLNAGMAVLVPLVVLGLPLAETVVSIARRTVSKLDGVEGARLFGADRRHFHHRLLDLGLDHRRAVLTLYGVGILLALCGFLSILLTYTYAALMLIALLGAAFIGIHRLAYDEFALVRRSAGLRGYVRPALQSAAFVVFLDLMLVMAAIYGAIVLKWDDWGLVHHGFLARDMFVIMSPVAVGVFWGLGMYRNSWNVTPLDGLARCSLASALAALLGAIPLSFILHVDAPLSFFILYTVVLVLLSTGARAGYALMDHSPMAVELPAPLLTFEEADEVGFSGGYAGEEHPGFSFLNDADASSILLVKGRSEPRGAGGVARLRPNPGRSAIVVALRPRSAEEKLEVLDAGAADAVSPSRSGT